MASHAIRNPMLSPRQNDQAHGRDQAAVEQPHLRAAARWLAARQ